MIKYFNKEDYRVLAHLHRDETSSCRLAPSAPSLVRQSRLMGQVHAKEALPPAPGPGSVSDDSGEIPLSVIKAKVVSVSVDGVTRTKDDVLMDSVSDLFKVISFRCPN